MPRIWADTLEEHGQQLRSGVVRATVELVSEHGIANLTMAGIAQRAGIGRATLYKRFGDVDGVLEAVHTDLVRAHIDGLDLDDADQDADEVLHHALAAHAQLLAEHPPELFLAAPHLHSDAHKMLVEAFAQLIERLDPAPEHSRELADYALAAITAASHATSPGAVERLVDLVWATVVTR